VGGLFFFTLTTPKKQHNMREHNFLNQENKSMDEALRILTEAGAVITDSHLVYTSGRHGKEYVNKDAIYPDTEKTSVLCMMIAQRFKGKQVEAVIAPAIGGVILSQWVAHFLTFYTGRKVLSLYAEKTEDGEFVIKRGYDKLIANKWVLVVEDVLTTGGSVRKVVQATASVGGLVVGLGALCNRGGIKPEDICEGLDLFALINLKLESWSEADCPLCKAGVPINTDVGKGREFLARKQA